jgi:uncharacterized membrane protein
LLYQLSYTGVGGLASIGGASGQALPVGEIGEGLLAKSEPVRESPLPKHGAFFIAVAVGLVALVICLFVSPKYAVAVGANALFAVYLGLTGWEFRYLTPAFLKRRAADADTPVVAIFGVTIIVVAVSVAFLFMSLNDGAGPKPAEVIASAISVLLGWFTVHTMAAFHYAYEYYDVAETSPDSSQVVGGLDFPGDDREPDGGAFLYFSYVVGMTAQVSDVVVTSNAMRWVVLVHGVFAFFFNTVILAATVNVVVTLAGN